MNIFFLKFWFFFHDYSMCDSLLYQVALLYYSPLLALDTRIIIKEERLSGLHWFAHKFAQSISKLRLKSTSCLYFSIEIFWQKKGEAFQFHSLQNTQVFIALYFSLSTSLREAGLMTSMYAAPIHNAIQPSDVCCKRSLNTIRSLLLACTQLWACPERQRGAVRVQTDSWVLMRSPIQPRFVQTEDQSSVMWQSFGWKVLRNQT